MSESTSIRLSLAPPAGVPPVSVPQQATAADSRASWIPLPQEVAQRFAPHVEDLGRKILETIQVRVPEYAKPLTGSFGKAITQAIDEAILGSINNVGGHEVSAKDKKWAEFFREVGRGVYKAGGSLESLQTSYWVGGQEAWRYIGTWGQDSRLSAQTLCTSAESIFALIEKICSYSIAGYTAAKSAAPEALVQQRSRLLNLILSDPPTSPQVIRSTASTANWTIPGSIHVVALHSTETQFAQVSRSFFIGNTDILADFSRAQPYLITAHPDRDLRNLAGLSQGWLAAVGPQVRLTEGATSALWARTTLQLMRDGIIKGSVAHAKDHLSTLWLMHDDSLLDDLSMKVLSPLSGLSTKQQDRLTETLLTWLECRGNTVEIAEALRVHPQTVRYRVHQLVDMFGDRLDDASERLDMQLALHSHRLRGTRPLPAIDTGGGSP
ncbi:helix-turn-helix domain-containing protein [Amycolatopsis sp. H20-H5]|uniref:PucR family transcriptional regulator n=1 Tax=Amycolatopsis sp. H20-H5 TaxID=3046309 RepID=UPI002DB5C132|nr:helix-turn-helix domain-containing protein [Amycolatopsis sp. H20-H5]MEC3975574.1 helix-turn-helix domain-containing protein [Amycolatopsis sp. H20-H5]